MRETSDVVVIGGAAVGSAVAHALTADPDFRGRVIVLEKDRSYALSASALSTSGVRQQFSSAVNVRLSRYTVEFLNDVERHLGTEDETSGVVFHQNGYLYLGGAAACPAFEANNRLQRSLGVDVHLLDRSELARRFPWLGLDDVAVGSFVGRGEGWIDGHGLMSALKRRARARGAEYRYVEAVGLLRTGDRVTGVRCSDGREIGAGHVVNAAGGGGRRIAAMAGLDIPVFNAKQMVFAFESPRRVERMPYTFTPDRLFVRPEGEHYIAGLGIGADVHADVADFDVEYGLFEEEIWPKLALRVAGFEEARLRSAWAGHYDMNVFDHNAVVGRVPGLEGFYLANGFSGHGLMHAPGIGRGIAELIVQGDYRTIDLSDLSIARVAAGRPIRENIQY